MRRWLVGSDGSPAAARYYWFASNAHRAAKVESVLYAGALLYVVDVRKAEKAATYRNGRQR